MQKLDEQGSLRPLMRPESTLVCCRLCVLVVEVRGGEEKSRGAD